MGKYGIRDDPYQLPAGVADSLDDELAAFPLEIFFVYAVLMLCGF